MTTLFKATLETAKILREVYEGAASALGTATTLIDTGLILNQDFYKNGTIWLLSGTGVLNKSRVITIFEADGGVFTFATVTTAVPSGARYAAATDRFPFWMLRQALNQVLQEYGVPTYDTSLTTDDDQVEYTLTAGVQNVISVEMAQQTTEPYGWVEINNWHELNGKLYLDDINLPLIDAMPLRLKYLAAHAEVVLDDDVLNNMFPIEFLKWAAAVNVLRLKYMKPEEDVAVQWQEAIRMKQAMANRYHIDRGAQPHTEVSSLLMASDGTT